MSMNLAFIENGTGHRVSFPFQTPTELTYAVMNMGSLDARREVLLKYVMAQGWDEISKAMVMSDFDRLSADPTLELSIV